MTTAARISRILSLVWLGLTVAIQSLVMYGLSHGINEINVLPVLGATVAMAAGVICFFALPKGKGWAWLVVMAAIVVFVIEALYLKEEFPKHINSHGAIVGLTTWRLIWRHLSPVPMPFLMIPYWVDYCRRRREEKAAASAAAPDSYLGVPLTEEEEASPRRAKRSVRQRNQK